MTDDNRKSQRENTRAILRSAIRDSRASSVQARIRITRLERDIDILYLEKSSVVDPAETTRIELKLRQSRQLRDQALRSLVSAEIKLQMLLKRYQEAPCTYRIASRPGQNNKNTAASS